MIRTRQGVALAAPSHRHVLLLAFVLAVVAAAARARGCLLHPVNVKVSHRESNVAVQVFGLGTVEARVTSKVGFKVSGVLVDLQADVGDRVPKGAMLARLDDREQSARVGRARASIEQAEANLQKATASVGKAQSNYGNAKSINERRQKLVQSNIASTETAQTTQAVQDAALADVNLANAGSGGEGRDQRCQSTTAARERNTDFHTLTAPYDAMVTARQKELGSALGAGESVFALIDPKTVWVLAYVDESKAGEIQVGEPAEIVLRSLPNQRFQGRVARIQPESDRVNEERRVEIAYDALPDNFNLGEQAEVYITTVRLAHPLLVPEAAIIGLGKNQGTVWTVEDGYLQQHTVTLGYRMLDGRYEITGGLPDKAVVATQLPSGLRSGRAAKIIEGQGS